MDTIKIEIEGVQKTVVKQDYVRAKTKQLLEFGYASLTEAHVAEQLEILLGQAKGTVTIIGKFMEKDIVK